MRHNSLSNAVHLVGDLLSSSLSLSPSLSLCFQFPHSSLSFAGIWLMCTEGRRGGEEGGAHLVSVLYESDVYVCNCGYG